MQYAAIDEITRAEFHKLINQGWRRFGNLLFRPACPSCKACLPLRVPVARFKPNRSQRRLIKQNSDLVQMQIGDPILEEKRVYLYLDHHEFHTETRDWPAQTGDDAVTSILNFIQGPLPVQEWTYYIEDELVAVAYIDLLPDGFSGIYFYHSPAHRKFALGNWICLTMIEQAKKENLEFIYLGYYVKGSISMEYKAAFQPNEILVGVNQWEDYLQ